MPHEKGSKKLADNSANSKSQEADFRNPTPLKERIRDQDQQDIENYKLGQKILRTAFKLMGMVDLKRESDWEVLDNSCRDIGRLVNVGVTLNKDIKKAADSDKPIDGFLVTESIANSSAKIAVDHKLAELISAGIVIGGRLVLKGYEIPEPIAKIVGLWTASKARESLISVTDYVVDLNRIHPLTDNELNIHREFLNELQTNNSNFLSKGYIRSLIRTQIANNPNHPYQKQATKLLDQEQQSLLKHHIRPSKTSDTDASQTETDLEFFAKKLQEELSSTEQKPMPSSYIVSTKKMADEFLQQQAQIPELKTNTEPKTNSKTDFKSPNLCLPKMDLYSENPYVRENPLREFLIDKYKNERNSAGENVHFKISISVNTQSGMTREEIETKKTLAMQKVIEQAPIDMQKFKQEICEGNYPDFNVIQNRISFYEQFANEHLNEGACTPRTLKHLKVNLPDKASFNRVLNHYLGEIRKEFQTQYEIGNMNPPNIPQAFKDAICFYNEYQETKQIAKLQAAKMALSPRLKDLSPKFRRLANHIMIQAAEKQGDYESVEFFYTQNAQEKLPYQNTTAAQQRAEKHKKNHIAHMRLVMADCSHAVTNHPESALENFKKGIRAFVRYQEEACYTADGETPVLELEQSREYVETKKHLCKYFHKNPKVLAEILKACEIAEKQLQNIAVLQSIEILSSVSQLNGQWEEAAKPLATANQYNPNDLERLKDEAFLNFSINEYDKAVELFSLYDTKLAEKLAQLTNTTTVDKKAVEQCLKEIKQAKTISSLAVYLGATKKLEGSHLLLKNEEEILIKRAFEAAKSFKEEDTAEDAYLKLDPKVKKGIDQFIGLYELTDGPQLIQLKLLTKNQKYNEAYKLAKKTKSEYKGNEEINEICDNAIAGKYGQDSVMFYAPCVKFANHIISDLAMRYESNVCGKVSYLSNLSNSIFPSLQSDIVAMGFARISGDAETVFKKNVISSFEKQWKKYKRPVTALSALHSQGIAQSFNHLKNNKLKMATKTTDLVATVGNISAVVMSNTEFGKEHRVAVDNLATGSQLVGTAGTFFKTVKHFKKGEKFFEAGSKLTNLHTVYIDLFASVGFSIYEFMCSEVNLPEKYEEFTLTDHFKKIMSGIQIWSGKLSEDPNYYLYRDYWVKFAPSVFSSIFFTNPISVGYTVFQGLLTTYNQFSGCYIECALQAMMQNALYHLKRSRFEEAGKSVQEISVYVSAVYSEKDSIIVKRSKIFVMEFTCAKEVHEKNFELVISKTNYKELNNKYIFSETEIPLRETPNILFYRLGSLIQVYKNSKDCEEIKNDFNCFCNIFHSDEHIDQEGKNRILTAFNDMMRSMDINNNLGKAEKEDDEISSDEETTSLHHEMKY